jgi:hypothetical protein
LFWLVLEALLVCLASHTVDFGVDVPLHVGDKKMRVLLEFFLLSVNNGENDSERLIEARYSVKSVVVFEKRFFDHSEVSSPPTGIAIYLVYSFWFKSEGVDDCIHHNTPIKIV